MLSYDAIIIGGGTNGLACAAKLQSAGRRILVLEAGVAPGGTAIGADFAPGFARPALAHIAHQIDPRVMAGMALVKHGLTFISANLSSTALSATGDHLVLSDAAGGRIDGSVSPDDSASWATLRTQLLAFARVLAPFKAITPPRLAKGSGNDYLRLAKLGLGVRALGKADFRELLRMMLINVADVLNDELGDDRLKGLVGFDATLGSWLGPQSPNSLILLLNRLAGDCDGRMAALGLPAGGMQAVAAAMSTSVVAMGATVRTDTRVNRLIIENDRACGVELDGGEAIRAPLIVSAINPKTTFLTLVGPQHLDTGFVNRVRAAKSRGAAAKLHLALTAAPDFRGAALTSRLVIAPSLRVVETAYNAVKYNQVPDHPVMEIVIPSAFEAGHAPPGQHLLSAIVQFAPHAPGQGHDAARAAMLANTLAVLETYAPGIGALISHAELLMPYDIEARYGLIGGNWHHGELSVEQMLFLRPFPGIAQYQTPIAGLWLAGAGCHPGGGISGAAGWNAAERIIKVGRI